MEKLHMTLEKVQRRLFGMTKKQAMKKGICLDCKEPIFDFPDKTSCREYSLSGLCPICQAKIFQENTQ